MKKIILSISLLFTLIFTSCYNVVLYNIREDVEPETALISGTIQTITRYTVGGQEFLVLIGETNESDNTILFAENKNSTKIFYKPADSGKHGEWITYDNSPVSEEHHYDYYGASNHVGEQLLLTHADSDYLYIVTSEYINDAERGTSNPSKIHVYAAKITLNADNSWNKDVTWTDIINDGSNIDYLPIYEANDLYYTAFSIFSTNAIQSSHRKVFIRSGDPAAYDSSYRTVKYYELNGTAPLLETTLSPVDSTSTNAINSAVFFNGSYMYFNSLAATTNETSDTDATMVYYGTGSSVYFKSISDTEFTKSNFRTGNSVSSLCVCKDALLIGRANYTSTSLSASGGIVKTSLDSSGTPGKELTPFTTNAEVQLSSSYFVLSLLNTDPSKSEEDSTLYASLTFFGSGTSTAVNYENIGLWSYYPARKNWNRE